MATGNFTISNRCIVVTDEQYEFCDYPNQTDYPTFRHWQVVHRSGYYADSSIDFIPKEVYVDVDFDTVSEAVTALSYDLECSKYAIQKHLKGWAEVKKSGIAFWKFLDSKVDDILVEIANKEKQKVNEYLDTVKEKYGLTEVVVSARFSNGETIYKEV